jgi:hypothetical protein
MDDVEAVIEQATDAIGTPPEAPAEAPKPEVKKVEKAAKKVGTISSRPRSEAAQTGTTLTRSAPAIYAANFSPQSGQGPALAEGSAPWPIALTVQHGNCQTLSATG